VLARAGTAIHGSGPGPELLTASVSERIGVLPTAAESMMLVGTIRSEPGGPGLSNSSSLQVVVPTTATRSTMAPHRLHEEGLGE
jgi:hypothetical protein